MGKAAAATKVSISVPDAELLEWAKASAERDGKSLSALFTDAVRFRRQLEARRAFLASWPERPALTPADRAAIRAEWAGGPRYEPRVESESPARPKTKRPKKAARAGAAKRRSVA